MSVVTTIRKVSLVAVPLGIIAGVAAVWAGFQHNVQGEFISETGRIDYGYTVLVFGSWFVLVALSAAVLATLGVLTVTALRRRP